MSFAEAMQREQRLAILQLLREASGYAAPETLLWSAMGELGLPVAAEALRDRLATLEEAGLVTVARRDLAWVATLSTAGLDVATGRAAHPEVARPRPDAAS